MCRYSIMGKPSDNPLLKSLSKDMMKPAELVCIFQTMKNQEEAYLAQDYLKSFGLGVKHEIHDINSLDSRQSDAQQWRFSVVKWCYQVVSVNEFEFSRDTVAIAINYLDRFLSTLEGIGVEKHIQRFQLAAMTCLYMAIKVHERKAIKPTTISALSKGTITEQQVIQTELKIATALHWRLNPPTPLSFVRLFLHVLPDEIIKDFEMWKAAKLTTCQTEIAVREYHFISYTASTIALAAIANTMQIMAQNRCGVIFEFNKALQIISKEFKIDVCSRDFITCRESLWILSPKVDCFVRQSSKVSKSMNGSKLQNDSPRSSTKFHFLGNSGQKVPHM